MKGGARSAPVNLFAFEVAAMFTVLYLAASSAALRAEVQQHM